MRLLTTLSACVLLAIPRTTLAILPLPEGYKVTDVWPVDKDRLYDLAKKNPHVPLLDAELECTLTWNLFDVRGYYWDGVTEEMIKKAVGRKGNKITGWNFWTQDAQECHVNGNGVKECTRDAPGWHAQFTLDNTESRQDMIMAFHELTGNFGRSIRGNGKDFQMVSIWYSNGTHTQKSTIEEIYHGPPRGRMFAECKVNE